VAAANRPRHILTESKPKLGVKERRKDMNKGENAKIFKNRSLGGKEK